MRHTILAPLAVMACLACEHDAADPPAIVAADAGTAAEAGPALPFALPDTGFPMVFGYADREGMLWVDAGALAPTPETPWQWASVTKQVIAVLVMQDVDAGRLSLDDTIADHLPGFAADGRGAITLEQLLRHTSGLGEPAGLPQSADTDPLSVCDRPTISAPGARFRYTNCDYIVLGAILERVNGAPWARLVDKRVSRPAGATGMGVLDAPVTDGRVVTSGRPHLFGAAGALSGPPGNLLRFNLALMDGALVSEAGLDALWQGDPSKGYVALGAWSFPAPLAGCDGPVRLVERRGHIGDIQLRSVIAPDTGRTFIAITSAPEAEFGEIWMGQGATHALASAALCN